MSPFSLVIKKLIDASCQEVFEAWSKPEIMKQWLFPPQWEQKASSTNDFKVGGQYKHDMISNDNVVYSHTGVYKKIIPGKKIVFTWNSDFAKDTLVTIELRELNEKTEVTLIHELFPTDEVCEKHREGWKGCLNNLEIFFTKNSYQCEVDYQIAVEKVYRALTEADGLKNWWTNDCTVSAAAIGSKSTFRFGPAYNVMQIKELRPNQKIVWECIEQFHQNENFTKNDEWVGTELTFSLTSNSNGSTHLYFIHKGLNKSLECFKICEKGWDHFLKDSLKAYLETGVGKPYN